VTRYRILCIVIVVVGGTTESLGILQTASESLQHRRFFSRVWPDVRNPVAVSWMVAWLSLGMARTDLTFPSAQTAFRIHKTLLIGADTLIQRGLHLIATS
jgi:hypothetical protein